MSGLGEDEGHKATALQIDIADLRVYTNPNYQTNSTLSHSHWAVLLALQFGLTPTI